MSSSLLQEIKRLFAAIQFFTRLPVPSWVGHSQQQLDAAARYFPLVGLLVGGIAALVLWLAWQLWTVPIALLLSMLSTLLVTGGFHEDGLADSVDGLGGGLTRERTLAIMKDSRIGAFGTLALIGVLALKFATLSALTVSMAIIALISAHTLSRFAGVIIMATLPYVRDDADSRSKPLVQGISGTTFAVAVATAAVAIIPLGLRGVIASLAALVGILLWRAYLRSRLGGYTGDYLGAAQQLSEVIFYLTLAAKMA